MERIIEWCNSNAGLLTGIQTLLTSIISIAAVVVSVKAVRYPYIKKVHLDWTIDDDKRGEVLYLWITNMGKVPITVNRVVATEILGRKHIKDLGNTDSEPLSNAFKIIPDETKAMDVVFGDINDDTDHMYGNRESRIKLLIEIKGKKRPFVFYIPWIYG